ncbi:rod shape-determining protein MreD [Roseobacteraceae bacterium S113]
MVETSTSRLLGMRAAYFGTAVVILFFQLIPLETVPRNWAAPDVLLALTFAWSLRRPDYVPALSIALVMVFADLLLHRPPGLVALLTVIACEYLKRRVLRVRNEGPATEFIFIATALTVVFVGARLVMFVLLIPLPPLGLSLFQAIATLLIYPIIILVSHVVFGVRARTPGDDAAGGRLA